MIYYRRYAKKMLPTNMLKSLVVHNNYVTDVYIEPILVMKYQLDQFHMQQSFIQQKQEFFQSSCYNQFLYTSVQFYLLGKE